jgi:hypothetical protein
MPVIRSASPPVGTIVRDRTLIGNGRFMVAHNFGPIGFEGECFAEIEPFPNIYGDPPTMVPAAALECDADFADA